MSDENVTLEETASEETIEQPVENQSVESVESPEGAEGASEDVTPKPESRKFAGKYTTVEDLEEAYQRSNAEATRMAQLLSQSTKETKTETSTPTYTPDQLEEFKEGRILEVSQAQALAAQAYASGNYQEAQKYEQAAKAAAGQIRLIDKELRKIEVESFSGSQKRIAAEERLKNDAVTVLKQYDKELVPGTELHTKASEILDNFVAMGMQSDSPIVQAQAVSLAAQALGIQSKNVAVNTRKELTKTISNALKEGVASGAGKASKGGAPLDFIKMSPKDFADYKRSKGLSVD